MKGSKNFHIQLRCLWCMSRLYWHTSANLLFQKSSLYVTSLLLQHSVANICQREICTKCLGQQKGSKHTASLGFACHVYHGKTSAELIHVQTHERLWPQLTGSSMHNNNLTDRKSLQLALLVLKKKTSQYTVAQGYMRAHVHFILQCHTYTSFYNVKAVLKI